MTITAEQRQRLEAELAASDEWWSPSGVARVLVRHGVEQGGSYWVARHVLKRLEDDGKVERRGGDDHFFEWWRWAR